MSGRARGCLCVGVYQCISELWLNVVWRGGGVIITLHVVNTRGKELARLLLCDTDNLNLLQTLSVSRHGSMPNDVQHTTT